MVVVGGGIEEKIEGGGVGRIKNKITQGRFDKTYPPMKKFSE